MDELSGPETSPPAEQADATATSPAGDSSGSSGETRPAETLTRDQYARQMRDGPSVTQDRSPGRDETAERPSATTRADVGAPAAGLAEPRSRAEVAGEARGQEVLPGRPDAPGGPDGLSHDRSATNAGWEKRFTVIQADRTIGDTTPTGIGLKPAGEQLRDLESDRLSRGDRLRRNVCERADDIQDVTEKNAGTLQGLFGAHRPAGQDVTFTAQPSAEA